MFSGYFYNESHMEKKAKQPLKVHKVHGCSAMNEPEVEILEATRDKDGTWQIVVICPFCGKKHYHGGGNGPEPHLGGRAAHCLNGPPRGYVLLPPVLKEKAK